MNGLEQAFYIIGIVFMSIMLLLLAALVAAVFVIRTKINRIHDQIEERLNTVATIAEKGGEIAALATGAAVRKAKNALKHKK